MLKKSLEGKKRNIKSKMEKKKKGKETTIAFRSCVY